MKPTFFQRLAKAVTGQELYSQNDVRRIAEFVRSKNGRRLTAELVRQTDALTQKDIAMWRNAWQSAINVDYPNRTVLYDIFTDCLVDLHLQGCIGQRKGMVMKARFYLADKDGKKDDRGTALLEREWFNDYCSMALDSRFWGHSLIQFGDIRKTSDGFTFDGVELVPRKHVCQEHGVLLRNVGDDWHSGIPYREGEFADWCLEVGKPYDLGLLLYCAPQCISKKNMLGFWDMFGEIFGVPMRIAKATTTDDRERAKIESALENMGSAFWGLFPEGTEIDIKESSRGDAFNVYDKRVDRCNSELSKGVLNQTMTIDAGSSLSQSETHYEVFENVIKADQKMLAYNINDHLLPFMLSHGFPVGGLRFVWDTATDFTPSEQREVERVLLQYYDIDPQYFIEKYNVQITGLRQAQTGMQNARSAEDFFA